MNDLKSLMSVLVAVFALATSGLAQQQQKEQAPKRQQRMKKSQSKDIDVSDSELKKFAKVNREVREMRQNTRKKMQSAIQEEGLKVKEFSKIRRAQMSQDSAALAKISDEKEEKYKNARKRMQKVQQQSQKKMRQKIERNDMAYQRFRKISQAVKQDKELQRKIKKMRSKDKQ